MKPIFLLFSLAFASICCSQFFLRSAFAQLPRNTNTELLEVTNEQAELRRELEVLELETRQIKQRLKRLDELAEVQAEIGRVIEQLEQAEANGDEKRATRLKAKIEPLERHSNDIRESMEVSGELEERVRMLQNLVRGLNKLKNIDEAPRSARYLAGTVKDLRKLQKLRGNLNSLDPETSEVDRGKLERQADALHKQAEGDEELIEQISRLLEALEDDREEEIEDLLPEISELRDELQSQRAQNASEGDAKSTTKLSSGEYFITQTWSQERTFRRPYLVNVPKLPESKTDEQRKLPVFVFLHGNGGNAKDAMRGFMRNRKKMASRYVMVFAQGYRESWNIVSERSKADDVGFIEAIVTKLATFKNVSTHNFTIMGASNGAALVNQLAIESKLPNIRNYICGVSPLNVWQYDGTQFKAKGDDNNYLVATTPLTGKRLMNISGTNDNLVPYKGGESKFIPAKDGKLAFIDAEKSTFTWAKQMGYEGEQLMKPTSTEGKLEAFEYLDGDVIHYKVNGVGHGATHEISERLLLNFIEGSQINRTE